MTTLGPVGSRVRVLGQNDARGRLLFPLPPNVPACEDVWESRVPVIIDRFAEHYCRAHVWASIIVFAILCHFGSRIKLVVLVRLSFPTHHPWAALGCPRKKGGSVGMLPNVLTNVRLEANDPNNGSIGILGTEGSREMIPADNTVVSRVL